MSLFGSNDAVSLRHDRLLRGAAEYVDVEALGDAYLLSMLRAAEREARRTLRCFLEPTEVLPEAAEQAEREAFEAAGVPVHIEPGYDLPGHFFGPQSWGHIVLFQRPIVAVHGVRMVYPSPYAVQWDVPMAWLRMDRKHGHLRFVPTTSMVIPLQSYLMQLTTGGREIPQMIEVRYRAGLDDIRRSHPDALTAIQRLAALHVLRDQFLPSSGSISADGLSESLTLDMDKHQDAIDRTLNRIRDDIHGPRLAVM
jgi:hypothetical protein